ncbi:tubby C-terminal domain-like protein [Bacillus manliponensis]|uniref:tubby C-terminal domain-like protein n=1 Tax=Bacillus manliponensis TaxID=574376 RepID=UPI00068DF395|nr:hypothetical protein [Bacillus manliponensis]
MSQFSYKLELLSTSTKPVEIYKGEQKVGVVKGFYKNIFMRILDYIYSSSSIISYELKDKENNIRIISKDATGLGRKKVLVRYIDNDNKEHEILMRDEKPFDIGEQVTFEYKNQKYVISKKPFQPAELLLDDHLIAEWKIQPAAFRVVMNIVDYDYIEEQYLILGLFHAYLYADKNG